MSEWVIYHNPKCSKSRETLALLEQRNIQPKIIEYLKTPLQKAELEKLIRALDAPASKLVRVKEDIYKELQFSLDTHESIVENLCRYPALLERPIVVRGDRAVIGRPPENIEKLI